MKKRILITGITGFAGSYLAEELVKNSENEVFGTYRSSFNESDLPFLSKVQLEKCDIISAEEVGTVLKKVNPQEIYHLAAAASPAESIKTPQKTFESNVIGELNLLEKVKMVCKDARILLVISAEVYGKVDEQYLPISELTPFTPLNPYAVSKIAQDYLGLQYTLSEHMDIVRARPFNHIGPRQSSSFVVSAFAKQLAEIEKVSNEVGILKVGNLEAVRDFTDVRDMVKAYILLMEKGESGEAYNIGSGEGVKISDILSLLRSFVPKETRVEEDPQRMRPADVPELVCDCTKLYAATGWKPQIKLEESLKDVLEYWRAV